MSDFKHTTLIAVDFIVKDKLHPREAWRKAAQQEFIVKSQVNKSCPMSTFLVLCEEGLIREVKKGKYSKRIKENRETTLKAIEYLKTNPNSNLDYLDLWRKIGQTKSYDYQMHVILILYKKGLLEL